MAKSSGAGMLGSGIFGFLGTTIVCNASDTSLYCTIMKGVNILLLIIGIILILYFVYLYITNSMGKKR